MGISHRSNQHNQIQIRKFLFQFLLKVIRGIFINNNLILLNLYQDAYLQEHYQMEINYETGQTISFFEKKDNVLDGDLDLFPPMRFCKAVNARNRKYI